MSCVKQAAIFYRDRVGFSLEYLQQKPNDASMVYGAVTIDFGEARPEHMGRGICFIQFAGVPSAG
uniref:Uncharacterized protein n=1 Tax=Magnetococcus massalia (strain MO-1) TaxID=451514 RepID=A0A1S7LJH3_MAGMO|nr:Protein of unknown function [Candidatus Magnetococcus massalia]